ncbi:EscU/YscU/HrcU family type III secretion system export apparatus switch protein [Roseateles terrae]|uniref:Type III secretion protein U n=1 Tax=Roseateles terrae TaxID=431060 RepID=A0ABR6GRW1_9BURK|nr:EscU/YscU/HrcU family type III secretion system export apparatus switch protein [Roseateles terrae]MBB3194442.1 type III secretion protein U [Roseateles terrae]OWQ88269.1 hypothetical protein CDN98_09100 [Roseateles terrae]
MGEKTLPPTPQRLQQAREDGQLGVSEEATRIIKLLVVSEIVFATEPHWRRLLSEILDAAIQAASAHHAVHLTLSLKSLFPAVIGLFVLALMPMLLATLTTLAQTKFNVAPKALEKGFEKLNIGNNLQQLVSPQKLLIPLLGPIKGGALIWVIYLEIEQQFPQIGLAYRASPAQGWAMTMELMHALVMRCVVVLIILMIADILLQRYLVWRQLRMDHSEMKQDYKQAEGDPMLKGMRKQTAKEIVLADGPPAKEQQRPSALVVNPAHIAVALLYEPEHMLMPVMMAAATDDEARAWRRRARVEGIPMVKYVALARHLLASGKPGEPIPDHTCRGAALLFKVIEEYERLAPELLCPPLDLGDVLAADDGDDLHIPDDSEALPFAPLAEVDDELGDAMFEQA